MQQRLIKLTIALVVVTIQFVKCKDGHSNIGYGQSYFRTNCSACHGENIGIDGSPGLFTLNGLDSSTLIKKLYAIKQDSLHSAYLRPLNYSNKEVYSIYKYIKYQFSPHY